ncbi:MAG: response regulator [Acidobacteria bacterium]|nr:response regulator [Acidobacteriota bacterium]
MSPWFRWLSDQPVARKALALGVVPTVAAIALVMATSTATTYLQVRRSQEQDLQTDAAIVAENVSAALAFGDRGAAGETISGFRAKSNIEAVCVFDSTGRLFVSLVQGAGACPDDQSTPAAAAFAYERPVALDGRQLGTVRLAANGFRLYVWMRTQTIVAGATLCAGLLLSFALTRWLARTITEPVLELAATAERISTSGDYGARAEQLTRDELGRLTASFNGMLDRIQRQHESMSALLGREQEASRLKDQFLAAVSHELRTPLNAILGWLHIVRTTKPTAATVDRALESLERNARAQARLVEDLIETSRAVTGKLQIKTEVVDLRVVVGAALDVVSAAMSAKSIRVKSALPPTAALVSGDPDRLQQVVWNLLSNALKFTPPSGSVSIDLAPDGTDFVIAVQDSGIGITAEFLPFAFDRFRQADGSMSREHGGLGLGLAIVKDLVERHRGSVAAASPGRNQGARFTVRLPRLTGSPREEHDGRAQPAAAGRLDGVRVLAVDDDPDALAIVTHGLRAAGADVLPAASGTEAIAIGRRECFDVLICDLAMPRIDGFEILKRLRDQSAAFAAGAFAIAVTAHASPSDCQRVIAAGFRMHLSKPYDPGELVRLIAAALPRSAGAPCGNGAADAG